MKQIKILIIASLGFMFAMAVPAQADVREVFACNYLAGKDMSDIRSARDFYLKQAKKSGIEVPEAFVWNLYKGTSNAEVLWFNNYENLISFGKSADENNASPEMAAVNARFNSVVDCQSVLAQRETIFRGGEPLWSGEPKPSVMINSNACTINESFNRGDLKDLWEHVNGVLGGMDEYKNFLLFASTPIMTRQGGPQLYLYGISNSVMEWASDSSALRSSEAGQGLMRHFQKVLSCNNSIWMGERMVPAE